MLRRGFEFVFYSSVKKGSVDVALKYSEVHIQHFLAL